MAFVLSAGQLASIQSADRYGFATPIPSYLRLSPTLSATYAQLWRAQPALRTVVDFLARNVAQLGVNVYRRVSDTDRAKLTDHPVARLLERPMPESKFTKYRLLDTVMHDLCIYDNAYLVKLRAKGSVGALVPWSPTMIVPVGPEWQTPQSYRIVGNTGETTVGADEVVHIHGYNPDDLRLGASPIETLRQILAEEYAATAYREQLWRNGARVQGYLKRPREAPRWSDGARERFAASWRDQYTGDGPQAGGTPLLEDGMEFVGSGVTPKDAQYVESRKLTREEVAVAYHVSPSMVGLTEQTNFSSIQELHRMLYQDTLAPYLAHIAQDLECQLLEDVDPGAVGGSVYVEFNLAEKLRGSFAEQTQALQSAVGGPWMTRAEARSMFNMPEIDGADELIVPLNVVEGGLASPNDTAPDSPSDEGNPKTAEILVRAFERQSRDVLSRIGAKAVEVFDRNRWDGELTDDLARVGADATTARLFAQHVNGRTESLIASACAGPDPVGAARRIFADLIERASHENQKRACPVQGA